MAQWSTLDERFVGVRFGELTVLRRSGSKDGHSAWLCRCDCGAEKTVAASNLTRGFTLSCGCRKARMVGKSAVVKPGDRFGRLVAESFVESRNRHAYFKFRCDCGAVKVISANAVKRGDAVSCGCYRSEHANEVAKLLPGRDGKAAPRMLFKDYRTRSKVRGILFELTFDQFHALTQQRCAYCGDEPKPSGRKRYGWFAANGVDRVDNSKGYTVSNACAACMTCNTAKSTMSVDAFKAWLIRAATHMCRA